MQYHTCNPGRKFYFLFQKIKEFMKQIMTVFKYSNTYAVC